MKKDKEQKLKLKKIWDNYTYDNQTRKLAEEQYELVEQLIRANYSYDDRYLWRREITNEIADNYVLIKQFMQEFHITDEEILQVANEKIERQLKRIELEKIMK